MKDEDLNVITQNYIDIKGNIMLKYEKMLEKLENNGKINNIN